MVYIKHMIWSLLFCSIILKCRLSDVLILTVWTKWVRIKHIKEVADEVLSWEKPYLRFLIFRKPDFENDVDNKIIIIHFNQLHG